MFGTGRDLCQSGWRQQRMTGNGSVQHRLLAAQLRDPSIDASLKLVITLRLTTQLSEFGHVHHGIEVMLFGHADHPFVFLIALHLLEDTRVFLETLKVFLGHHLGQISRLLRPVRLTTKAHRADLFDLGSSHWRSEEHTSELQSPCNLVCRLLLEKKITIILS